MNGYNYYNMFNQLSLKKYANTNQSVGIRISFPRI